MTQPAHQPPQIIDSTEIFSGRVFSVTVDTIREGETTYKREVVHHPGSAVIIPAFPNGTVALVRQYRHPALRYLLEAPAGTLNHGERPEEGAARELARALLTAVLRRQPRYPARSRRAGGFASLSYDSFAR